MDYAPFYLLEERERIRENKMLMCRESSARTDYLTE